MAPGDKTHARRVNSGIDPSASPSGLALGFFSLVPARRLRSALAEPPWAFLFCCGALGRERESRLVPLRLPNGAVFAPARGEI